MFFLKSHISLSGACAGIIANVKFWYQSEFINYTIDQHGFPIPIGVIYKIHHLNTMKLAGQRSLLCSLGNHNIQLLEKFKHLEPLKSRWIC